ncbi:phage major capsid protein [Phycicoccus jejuensis]|uniref:phage major capsid protein n=1 Tax=Phycicoccus jejuensis TaxID=367299 RepID=UPI0004C33F0A|nr:phage major capsid protein [Phycicoccus jejuensis]
MATILERYAAAKQAATELHNKAKTEDRPLTDDERAKFDELVAEASDLKAQHERAAADRAALADLSDLGDAPSAGADEPGKAKGSLGEQFVNSAAYKRMLASYNGQIPSNQRVQMDAARLDIQNALVTDPGLANPAVRVAPLELAVFDLFDAITVINDSPQAVKTFTSTWTDAAEIVAEGALKPEATLVWDPVDFTLKTIAQHVPVTNQALGHNPTLRSRIDTYLVNGIRAKMQARVAAALAAATGVQVQAFNTDLRTTMRKAITKAQYAQAQLGGGPIGTLVSAADAETLDLEAMAAAFTAAGEGPKQLQSAWRTPLVVSAAIPSGFSYTGDLKQIELYVSGGINVMTGWVNDQFIRNSLTILGETEAEANVFNASLLVKTDLTAA